MIVRILVVFLFVVSLVGILATTLIHIAWGDEAYWTWAIAYASRGGKAIALSIAACDLIAVGLVLTAVLRLTTRTRHRGHASDQVSARPD